MASHLQGHDPQKQQQQCHNLEVSNSHKLKWFQKYHPAAHLQLEYQVNGKACRHMQQRL